MVAQNGLDQILKTFPVFSMYECAPNKQQGARN